MTIRELRESMRGLPDDANVDIYIDKIIKRLPDDDFDIVILCNHYDIASADLGHEWIGNTKSPCLTLTVGIEI